MLHILTSEQNRNNDDIEGFGYRWDSAAAWGGVNQSVIATVNYPGIPANSSKIVTFKPLSGLFNQPKFIPLMWCPITLEFEMVGNENDCVISPGAAGGASNIDTTNTTTSWSIEQVQLKCDLVTLDSALQNSYAEHVLSGKALPINYSTYVTQHQSLANGLPLTTNVSRAVSRLKSVFINLDGNRAAIDNRYPVTYARKDFNAFMHPMIGDYSFGNELQFSSQIGSRRFPEYPMMSASVLPIKESFRYSR